MLMQVPLNKLLALLGPDNTLEVRRAAALVLGELGVRDAEVTQELRAGLQDPEAGLRLEIIKAIGKLRLESALPQLLARIREGGEEAAEAAHAAARLGAKGTRALQDLMPQVAPGLRRYIAAALAASGTPSAEAATAAVLLDKDPGVVEAAARSLITQVPGMTPTQRAGLAEHLLSLLANKKAPPPAVSEAALVRVLAALDDPEAAAVLWDRILPPHAPETRAAALQALGRWITTPGKEQLKRLFACASDPDFRVAAPALFILKALPAGERAMPEWLELLHAPDVAVRRLAVEKVGGRDSAEVALALLEQLDHADRGLRDLALSRLARLEQGRKALTRALLEAESPDRAWTLARAQAPFVKEYPAKWRDTLFTQSGKYLESADRRADALLFLLREADAAELRERLEARALALRKKKDYATALLYLRLLARDPAVGFPVRWELAACGLKVSAKELSAEVRATDPSLQQFISLTQGYETELVKELEKAKWLDADDLYYLGFHLAEKEGPARRVGGRVLHLVVKRSPRSKLAQAARSKIRSEGLE
jgi:HEAT repeat protein